MPLFSAQLSIDTQHEASWESQIYSAAATTNYQDSEQVSSSFAEGRGPDQARRVVLAFDLSDLENRTITSATLTMKTTGSAAGATNTNTQEIYLISGNAPVYDEVTWDNRRAGMAWLNGGGDYTPTPTATIEWPAFRREESFTSSSLVGILSGLEGQTAHLLIKTAEINGGGSISARDVIAHDEDDVESKDDLPTLNITSTTDHRNVYTKHEMVKYMNKAVGIKGKSSVPSLG